MDRLSVVISTRDRAWELDRCLRSLAPERSEIHEIIIVDDGSVDTTTAVAHKAGATVIRLRDRMGICVARNAGAAQAGGEILAFVDDDTEVAPGWATELRLAFADGPALVGGRIHVPPPKSLAEWFRGKPGHHDPTGRSGFLPFVCGANFAIRAEVFRELGGFDEVLPSSEDMDLSFRAQLGGYEVAFPPDAALTHWSRSSIRGMLRQRAHHVHGDRVVSHKYREFPLQRTKLWRRRAPRVLLVQTAGQLMNGVGGDRRRLTYPTLSCASVIAEQLGVLKADFELLTGRRPRPALIPCADERQRWTATELPSGPSVLFIGDDWLVARVLRITLEASGDLSVAPDGLAAQALACWDEPAPAPSELAWLARRAGWLSPPDLISDRLEREQPDTWGEAFCVLHAFQCALLRRPRFGLLALGDGGPAMARQFPELPVVAVGEDPPVGNEVIFRVTRRGLLQDRRRVLAALRRALRDHAPAVTPSPLPVSGVR
jgi:GT2 family glycosyltransferase